VRDENHSIRVDPQNDPKLIQVFDQHGRELLIEKETWRTEVLPTNIQSNWNSPDDLYKVIILALRDGFLADVGEAAQHLYEIDSDRLRATIVWGIVLTQQNLLDEAEALFNNYTKQYGENGILLTNLAKVFAERGDTAKAETTLWHALELDPNQDNGLDWYYQMHEERGGDDAGVAAWRRVARLPGSWRAQLRLARRALTAHNWNEALSFYRACLSVVADPVPTDMLAQISGDLGNAGLLTDLLLLSESRFDPAVHGLEAGNNLIKANLELGRIDEAKRILDQLNALKRMDWQPHLSFWGAEIADKRRAFSTPTGEALRL
jgi:tetratricopeptide (TPR) repeat protein